MSDFDEEDIDVCTSCGRYFGWATVRDLAAAHPLTRPFPQQCRRCLHARGFAALLSSPSGGAGPDETPSAAQNPVQTNEVGDE